MNGIAGKREVTSICNEGLVLLALAAIACSGKAIESNSMTSAGGASENVRSTIPDDGDELNDNSADEANQAGELRPASDVDAAAYCRSEYLAHEPFDVGGEPRQNPAVPGETTLPTLAEIVAECELDSGLDCSSSFISKDAARCIAESDGFAQGLQPWIIQLVYHRGYQRVKWSVLNLLEDRGTQGSSGTLLDLNAVDGSLLGRLSWEAIP